MEAALAVSTVEAPDGAIAAEAAQTVQKSD